MTSRQTYRKVFSARAAGMAALCFAGLALGCATQETLRALPIDPVYLSRTPERDRMSFHVIFARYRREHQEAIDAAWSAAGGMPEEADATWRANGLQAAFADAATAARVREALAAAQSFEQPRRQVVMPSIGPFEIVIGSATASGEMSYFTGEEAGTGRFENVQPVLRVLPLPGEQKSFSVTPCFYSGGPGTVSVATELSGAVTVLPFEEGGVLLVGPLAEAGETTLGGMLSRNGGEDRRRMLILIEPRWSL